MALHRRECAMSIIREYFGPVVSTVCDALKFGSLPLNLLSNKLSFSKISVIQALSILINFNFVEFKELEGNKTCEYSLLTDNILLISKYPRFLLFIRNKYGKYGKEAEFIIRELLLYSSRMKLHNLIVCVHSNMSKVFLNSPYKADMSIIVSTVCDLIQNHFIIPIQQVTNDFIPKFIDIAEGEIIIPEINMQALYSGKESDFPEDKLWWRINFDRFLVEYRNEVIVNSMMRRYDVNSCVVLRHLLKLSFVKSDPWRPKSNGIPMSKICNSVENDSNHIGAVIPTEQYIQAIEDDSSGLIEHKLDGSECHDYYAVCFQDFFNNLAVMCISQVVEQKFGFKASRVFRIVQKNKYIEIEEIQKLAMLADKEANQITYKLLEENFLQMQELRKPMESSNESDPDISYFIFYVDINLVVSMVIGMCYKTWHNFSLKWIHELDTHKHLIEKKQQTDEVLKAFKELTEEQIEETMNAVFPGPEGGVLSMLRKIEQKLFFGQMQIDETIFLLQCYIIYNKKAGQNPTDQKDEFI